MAGGGIPFEVFLEFSLLLVAAAVSGALFTKLKQPVLVAFLVIGIVSGPSVLDLQATGPQIQLLAVVGVIVLLVLVGLKLDLEHVKNIGPVALATGLGQLTFTILGGFLLSLLLGLNVVESIYIAVALTFSSTIIIVKLLSDKKELEHLHGRIAVGFLIVQDLAVVLAMMVISTFGGAGESDSALGLLWSLAWRIGAAIILLFVTVKIIVTPLLKVMATSEELLLIFVLAWGLGLAALGEWAGFSKEAGAFVAGFTLATTAYHEQVYERVSGLRDFLVLFFFIDMGANLELSTLSESVGPALVLSVFVLVGNPLIVMAIMGYMGYKSRTGFLAGLTVAQISEFSLVFVSLGISLGQLEVNSLGLVTLVGLITITLSTYMILYSAQLYSFLAPYLKVFEREVPFREQAVERDPTGTSGDAHEVVVIGVGRYGGRLMAHLVKQNVSVLGVDSDPEVVAVLHKAGLSARFGDIHDKDFLASISIQDVKVIVFTLPTQVAQDKAQKLLRNAGYNGQFTVVSREKGGLGLGDAVESGHHNAENKVTTFHLFRDAADYAADSVLALVHNARADGSAGHVSVAGNEETGGESAASSAGEPDAGSKRKKAKSSGKKKKK